MLTESESKGLNIIQYLRMSYHSLRVFDTPVRTLLL